MVIDNTTKTRALFEINKGTNRNSAIDVNSRIVAEDRRIPFQNMIYIADGPSDVPSFSVVKGNGGIAYGVYNPAKPEEYTLRTTASERLDESIITGRPTIPSRAARLSGSGSRSRAFAIGSSEIARRRFRSGRRARPVI